MSWRFDIATAIGGRAEQQDRAGVFTLPGRADSHLVVLADGMGGHADGDLAAQAVLDTAAEAVGDSAVDNPREFLAGVCERANHAVMQVGRGQQSTPGSTCVLLYLSGDEAYWVHVGDSRLYHFGASELLAQTRDHTVGELIAETADSGSLDPGSAALLYTCLGGQNALQPEHGASILGERDWFLLCSDGFWHQVDAAEAAGLRQAARSADGVAARMVELAVQRGGARGDNVSLVLATRSETRLGRLWRRVRGG